MIQLGIFSKQVKLCHITCTQYVYIHNLVPNDKILEFYIFHYETIDVLAQLNGIWLNLVVWAWLKQVYQLSHSMVIS